ncbi:MAG: cytochrome c prime [Proteobacteria bacterium]|nr:cytochrome c prime [Pseudomonadota bacterium]
MKVKNLAFAVVAMGVASGVLAQVKPEDQIRYRQSVMNVMGRSFGALNAMAKGEAPYNKDAAAKNAAIVEMMSGLPAPAFGPGTDKGAPTKADMKIWSEGEKFKTAYEKMVGEVKKLPAAAGDEATLKAQVGEVGKACKGCHDDFRLKEFRN